MNDIGTYINNNNKKRRFNRTKLFSRLRGKRYHTKGGKRKELKN